MKDPEAVRQFVVERMNAALERPHMYASSPEALEDVLCALDEILRRIAGDDDPAHYGQYLASCGYGAATFCERERLDSRTRRLTDEDRRLFQALAQF